MGDLCGGPGSSGFVSIPRAVDSDQAPYGHPGLADHWHSAYSIYVCDEISPWVYFDDSGQDTTGIHSHGDGLIHIHPFVTR